MNLNKLIDFIISNGILNLDENETSHHSINEFDRDIVGYLLINEDHRITLNIGSIGVVIYITNFYNKNHDYEVVFEVNK